MYTRKTTMTRLINRLIERTVSLVSGRRAPPMGPMQTMLTSPLGQAGIRPLLALAAIPGLQDTGAAYPPHRITPRRYTMNKKCALFLLVALSIVASGGNAVAAPVTVKDTVTVNGKNTVTVSEGKYIDEKGVTRKTPKDDLDAETKANKGYDGDTEFKADYTIVLKDDKTVDSTKSTATFITVKWTLNGREKIEGRSQFQ